MNCRKCQQTLLQELDQSSWSPQVAAHLAQCLDCQQCQQRLEHIEANLRRLQSPKSRAKEVFLRQLLRPVDAPAPDPVALPASVPETLPFRKQRRIGFQIAAGLAAAIFLTLTGIWLGNWIGDKLAPVQPMANHPLDRHELEEKKDPPSSRAPLAALILDCDLRLAETQKPEKRLEILADLAQVLHEEARLLTQAKGPKELQKVAFLYERVLDEGLLKRAGDVPAPLRRQILAPIAQRLVQARQDSEARAQASDPGMSFAHRRMAQTAMNGHGQLLTLMGEALP